MARSAFAATTCFAATSRGGERRPAGARRLAAHRRPRTSATPTDTIAFAGVIKPMFTRNGFNIYPREIERVVREMPGVERARSCATVARRRIAKPEIALEVTGSVTRGRRQALVRRALERLQAADDSIRVL